MASAKRDLSRQGAWLVALGVVAIDQLSKAWALSHLGGAGQVPFVPGLLNLQLVFNSGAAFSLLTNATWLLAGVSLLVTLALLVWIQLSAPLRPWQLLGAGLLLGGAIGNGLDRWRLGTVVDFLALVPIPFPIFNGADVAINLAVICIALDLLRRHGPSNR
jgi:signal peptidase II